MSPLAQLRPARWLPALLVALVAALALGALFHRTSWSDWRQPRWLEGDPVEVYLRVKIAGEQPGHALWHFNRIERLGAPFTADWSAYPVPDRLVFVATGLLARAVGLFAAVNLMSALITGLNAASFYVCARWLRCRIEWAAALALVFALGNYSVRWGVTLSLNQIFFLPPLVLLCAHAARAAPARGSHRTWWILALGLAAWLGIGNPYLAFFAGAVGTGAAVLGFLRGVPLVRRLPLLAFLAALLAGFLLSNFEYIAPLWSGATGGALVRSVGDYTAFALRPWDWLVPPAGHRWPLLGRIGRAYLDAHREPREFFYNYLGVLGVAGLAAWLLATVRDASQRRWRRLDVAWGFAWILAFATPLGVNRWLATAGLDYFRAGGRIGVYATIWILFWLAVRCSRACRTWPRAGSVAAALGVALFACCEQTPALGDRAGTAASAARWAEYRQLARSLETALPAGAAVFQLPVVPFPEAGRRARMPDYEHALPYLASDSLRISYGQLRRTPAFGWGRHVARLPAAAMVTALQHAGFSVLWIDPRGYPDGAADLLAQLEALGLPELGPTGALRVRVFHLYPDEPAQQPDPADPRWGEPWDERGEPREPLLLALDGWYPPEQSTAALWRWARRHARAGVWWSGAATEATLRFVVAGPANRTVELRRDAESLGSFPPGPQVRACRIVLQPGLNRLEWTLHGPLFRPGGDDPRRLGFMVENLSVSVP